MPDYTLQYRPHARIAWADYHTKADAPRSLTAAHQLRQRLEADGSGWQYRIVEGERVVWPAEEDEDA